MTVKLLREDAKFALDLPVTGWCNFIKLEEHVATYPGKRD
jgi:hypothetical protein